MSTGLSSTGLLFSSLSCSALRPQLSTPEVSQSRRGYAAITDNLQVLVPSNHRNCFSVMLNVHHGLAGGALCTLGGPSYHPNIPSGHTIETRATEGLTLANKFSTPQPQPPNDLCVPSTHKSLFGANHTASSHTGS